ncbi:MAG: hypothetical protein ACYST6_18235, partial [Planctomycetota bacterium]
SSTTVENPLQIAPFLYKRTQSQKYPKSPQPLFLQRLTQTAPDFSPKNEPKTNPNEPKQSQSDPHFSLVRGTQSQNEPKRTQSKPNLPKTQKTTQPSSTQGLTNRMPNSPHQNKPKANPIKANLKRKKMLLRPA